MAGRTGNRTGRPRGRWSGLATAVLIGGTGLPAIAAEPGPAPDTGTRQLSLETGLAHESQRAPLVRFGPEDTPVYLPGVQRLGGPQRRVSASGLLATALTDGFGASLAGDLLVQRASGQGGSDLQAATLQPSVHLVRGLTSVGVGLNLQHQDVARSSFRTTRTLQFHASRADTTGSWALLAEGGTARHPGELAPLDLHLRSLLLQRQLLQPLPGLDDASIGLLAGRERSLRGQHALSSHVRMVTASVSTHALGARWQAGLGWRRARFDEALWSGEPPRREHLRLVDLSAQWPLGPVFALRLEWHHVRTDASIRLYEMRYRQVGVSLVASW